MKPIFNLPRLLIEILATVAVAEMLIMLILPEHVGQADVIASGLVDAAVLVIVIAPVIFWRTQLALNISGSPVDFSPDLRSARWVASVVLLAGFLLTAWTTVWRQRALEDQAGDRFGRVVAAVDHDVQSRFHEVQAGLEVMRGLFMASTRVERSEFRAIVESLRATSEFPGVRQFGFIQAVPRDRLGAFIAEQKAEGAEPEVQPGAPGQDGIVYVGQFLEPLSSTPSRPMRDLGEMPEARSAFDQALVKGLPVLSGKLTGDGADPIASSLLYVLPVHRQLTEPSPQSAQGAHPELRGVLYALLSPSEFMAGVGKSTGLPLKVQLLSEGASPLSEESAQPSDLTGVHAETREFSIGMRRLMLRVSADVGTASGTDGFSPLKLAITGGGLSLLLGLTVWLLGAGRARAMAMAMAVTRDLELAKHRAETALRESQELLFALHQHAIVSITDSKAIIVDVNDLFCKISGYTREELIGQPHRIVNSGFHDRRFWSDMWRTIASGNPWRGVVCNRSKAGNLYWVDSLIAPFRGPDGRIDRYVSIRFDITNERRMAEELTRHRDHLGELVEAKTFELVAAKEAVESASRAKSAFFASMSHELRTPLHAILAFAGLGLKKRDVVDVDKLVDYFGKIHLSGEQMLKLVDDLLTLSQSDAGQMEFDFQPCDVAAIANEAIGELDAALVAKSLRVELTADTDCVTVPCDRQWILQVMRNLLANAVRFSPAGGLLRIVLSRVQMAGRRATDEPIAALQLELHDQGPGFPEDEIERVLDEFLQSCRAKSAGGTGLGLHVCKRVVQAHRGTIWALNRKEGGASLYLNLPYSKFGTETTSHG